MKKQLEVKMMMYLNKKAMQGERNNEQMKIIFPQKAFSQSHINISQNDKNRCLKKKKKTHNGFNLVS